MNLLGFSQFSKSLLLTEGLIKVPSDLLMSMCKHILGQYVSYMNMFDKCKNDAVKLAKKYGVEIDQGFQPVNLAAELNTVLEDVPERIKNSWKLEFGYLRLLIDWENKIWTDRPKVNASYEESDAKGIPGYFTINPRTLVECVNSPDYNIFTAMEIFEKVAYSAWHEATHAVQHNSLKWVDRNQVAKSRVVRDNPDSSKEDRRREYLSAQVEFDPQIKTKIYVFNKMYGSDKENLRKNLAIFVGALQVTEQKPDEFFAALKATDIRRWKNSVKLMYLNYQFDVSSILRTIPE
jgi:hypothetical protein